MPMDPQRRSALLSTKLAALVRDHAGANSNVVAGTIGGGAGLLRDGVAWVLAEEQPSRYLGPAMAWARQQGTEEVHLLAEDPAQAGLLARRAERFQHPPTVWEVRDRSLIPTAPWPLLEPAVLDPRAVPLMDVIAAAGATPVVEHGVLTGEVYGLEMCRAVVDAGSGALRLDVGVGAHDREAFTLMNGDVPTPEALAKVVAVVARHRAPGAEPHPLNRLVPERGLRHRLVTHPSLLGLASLSEAPPPLPRNGVKERWPAVAVGSDHSGRAVVVVCSTGVDLDVVPYATDARCVGDRLIIVVPARDVHPVTASLVDRLLDPAELVAMPES